ncbi:collagen alpha-6(VI) chain-like isoform X2 [Mugil cephalus]|uniref:collagen alpha-6(VI) chain-like isoform X2 n=1 Tax=Mugil cephalus TaxID=48193 RepID=UPI001FB70E3B|nr:collagen alpha-6(VI) chain-like isoform X2 [Mugil cephalus]
MHLKNYIVWLIYMVAVAASVSLAFNIDATTQHTITTEQYFIQHKVLRPIRRVPTASAQLNGCEEMRNSDLDRTHVCIVTPDISLTDTTLPVKHFGLSIVETSRPSELTVCRPSAVYGCHNNSSPKNVCYKMGNRQQISSSESTNKTVELVFLFDGSRSMTEAEFNKNKDFIVEIINSLKNTSIKFAAVQFSTDCNKVFDFKDFEAGTAIDKLMKEPHMKGLTYTHRALEYVLSHIFENPEAGASPNAVKVLVLITDGDSSDPERNGIVKKYDEKNIIRIAIGVRDARLDKSRIIASEPKDRNTFKIEDYHGLTGILENLVTMVKVINAEEQMNEMSPSGFSVVFYKACGPSAAKGSNESSYLNTVCYKISHHQSINSFTPSFQEYTKASVELVFLFDGSRSMTEAEFNKNKDFIVEIMNSLKNTSVKFAAVQFSTDYNKVFDFKDYESGTAIDKLMKEPHMKGLTNTYKALEYVLSHIFENPEAGASPDAAKVLVLITDGDPSDYDRNDTVKTFDEKNTIRFVIGVKEANLDKFREIASEPKDQNAFKTENYDGLRLKLGDVVTIANMAAEAEQMNDMSPSGFSAVFYKTCGPSAAQERNESSYLNTVCYSVSHLQSINYFTPGSQEYTKTSVDLVFLLDGSKSMTGADFNKNKDLIVEIMESLKDMSIKFAVVQFSTHYNKVFDFNDKVGTAIDKLQKEPHMKGLINTHRALTYVLYHIFENPEAGASPDATKVLVLITDGDPSDPDRNGIVKKYDEKNIIRFVIGVKDDNLDKYRVLASEQKDQNVFKTEDYDELTRKLEDVVTMGNMEEYTKKPVELVFLFDGSKSMTHAKFDKNKVLIEDIMDSLKGTSIKFAAVQFSTHYNKVFDFKDKAGTAIDKLQKEPHMKGLINTHRALTYVLSHIFENPEAGASPNAAKVLVLITDGDPSDPDRNGIVKKYDEKNIIRFVIGFRDNHLDKYRVLASEPKDQNVFKTEDYDELTRKLEDVVTMANMAARAEQMTKEISQRGFSAVFYEDSLVLGSVTSNSWRSSLQELRGKQRTQVADPDMQIDSYIGYSVSTGVKNGHSLYFTGAPSFENTGQVVLFIYNGGNWTVSQTINGDQIGSYFGAELCSLDVNSNNDTDFLLVGAPLFNQSQEEKEGRIYIYTLTDEIRLRSELQVLAPSKGRFGSTISSLADLNGDGLRDVAVGAPLEDDNRGAVYIFLGDRNKGIQEIYSQRITGEEIIPGIRFFGQAIDGNIDAREDGLPRIVIGSPETSVVLRQG